MRGVEEGWNLFFFATLFISFEVVLSLSFQSFYLSTTIVLYFCLGKGKLIPILFLTN